MQRKFGILWYLKLLYWITMDIIGSSRFNLYFIVMASWKVSNSIIYHYLSLTYTHICFNFITFLQLRCSVVFICLCVRKQCWRIQCSISFCLYTNLTKRLHLPRSNSSVFGQLNGFNDAASRIERHVVFIHIL